MHSPRLYIIHISTVPAMQSSFGCEAGRGGLRKGGMWVRSGEDKGGGGGNSEVRGWMRGVKQERGSAVMLGCSLRGSFFLCCAPPYRPGY